VRMKEESTWDDERYHKVGAPTRSQDASRVAKVLNAVVL
jgi:hypothetical protein